MTNLADLVIHTGKIEGRYVAATGRSPYFYFEAETEEGALDLARRALVFYERTLAKHDGRIPSPAFTGSIKAKELAA
jgi:predicted RNase H-like HicB family nuclease